MIYRLTLILVINCYIANSWASNELQEMEYAEEIESSYSIGQAIWLQAKGRNFLALHTETEQLKNTGAAIILHPMNGHPNQKKLINPLRTYLPQHQWPTLSIQLPVLGIDAKEQEYYPLFDDAQARIQAGIDYLAATTKVKNIVLIGYGLGGMMATYYLKDKGKGKKKKDDKTTTVEAIVAISLSVPKTEDKHVQIIDFISQIELPFLDIYAEYDLPAVTDSARKRRIAAKASSAYRQFQIEGESHLFQHDEGWVVKRIYSWIYKTFKKARDMPMQESTTETTLTP